MKDKDTQQHCPDGSDACPDGIGNANGNSLRGFCQKHGTQHIQRGKARNPQPILRADSEFGFPEAESEACFTEACNDKDDPVHECKGTKNPQPKASPELQKLKEESLIGFEN